MVAKIAIFWQTCKRLCKLFGFWGFLRKYKSGDWLKIKPVWLKRFV